MGKIIDLEAGGDVGKSNASKLHDVSGELPSSSVISQVDGNRSEEASEWFTSLLETRSTTIAMRVTAIRQFVTANADALNAAIDALREADSLSAADAEQAAAVIDDVAAGKSLLGAAAGANAGGTAGTSTTGAADGAKQVFGG
jgi:hypothetical protein